MRKMKTTRSLVCSSHDVVLIVLILLVSGAGCTRTSELSGNEARTIVGKVYVMGNEPFTRLAVEMENKQVYVLHCSKEIETMLLSKQGQLVRVHIKSMMNIPEGKAVEVTEAEVISR